MGVVGVGLCICLQQQRISTCFRGVSHFKYACVVDGFLIDKAESARKLDTHIRNYEVFRPT